LLAAALYSAEWTRSNYDFERRVQNRAAAIARSVDDAALALRAAQLLLQSSPGLGETQYRDFVAPLVAPYTYLHALLFYRFVPDEERPAYEARRASEWPGFRIRERSGGGFVPALRRPRYLALDMAVPRSRHVLIQGYDI